MRTSIPEIIRREHFLASGAGACVWTTYQCALSTEEECLLSKQPQCSGSTQTPPVSGESSKDVSECFSQKSALAAI